MTSKQRPKVLCIGECMVEFSPSPSNQGTTDLDLFRRGFAGDTYNTAVYLARQFSPRLDISYCTGLGADGLSQAMLAQFNTESIRTDNVRLVADRQPGLYLIENDENGERSFQYWRSQSAAKRMFAENEVDDLVEEFSEFDAIYLSGISLAILDEEQREKLFSALSQLKSDHDILIVFDPNFRPTLWPDHDLARSCFLKIAALANLALVTLDDDHALWGGEASPEAALKRWSGMGGEEVVIKDGASRCLISHEDVSISVAPPELLEPIDTTGAGDAFAAGYLGARLLGISPQKAADLAHRVAGQVIMKPGGVISKSHWQAVSEE